MFKFLGIGLGCLRNTIKNEKAYIYPCDISRLGKEQHDEPENVVVKISRF